MSDGLVDVVEEYASVVAGMSEQLREKDAENERLRAAISAARSTLAEAIDNHKRPTLHFASMALAVLRTVT